MSDQSIYKLGNVLTGHTLDIRGLAAVPDSDFLVSASRDNSARLWKLDRLSPESTRVFKAHEKYVVSVCILGPTDKYPATVLTGSNDNTICAFDLQTGEVLYKLTGHKDTVCCLFAGHDNDVLSSSWDGTARLWRDQKEIAVLDGHTMTVWCVIELPNSKKIITASADKTVKIWSNSTCEHTLTGHEDCVRGISAISSTEFLTCANDATIRAWNLNGDALGVYYGHSNYIYSVAVIPTGGFASCGEDHCLKIWNSKGETIQTITIPAQSVWCVTVLPNGDIATGSSDGTIRIFSNNTERQVNEDAQATFSQEVENFMKTNKLQLGGVKVNDLPGAETLLAPGNHDGQTKMIREGDKVNIYQWSASKALWDFVGEAVGAEPTATEGKTTFKGKEYDFVFSVDIEDGKPPLKLPYNKSDDPWVAAQAFIHDNDLSQMFLDTIANFIIKNSGQSGNSFSSSSSTGGYVDPFTGGARYVPGSNNTNRGPSAVNADPFTGGSSYTSTTKTPQTQTTNITLPLQLDYHLFEQANVDGINVKLKEFNKLAYQPLTDEQIDQVTKLADPNYAPTSDDLNILQKLLTWHADRLFPVLDLARLAIRNEQVNKDFCSEPYSSILISSVLKPNLTPQANEISRLMALRLAANMLAYNTGEELASKNVEYFVSVANQLSMASNNPSARQQVALSTLLFNLSVASYKGHRELRKVIFPITALVSSRLNDTQAQLRCVKALCNLLNNATADLLMQAKDKKLSETMANLMNEPKVTDIAAQILAVLP